MVAACPMVCSAFHHTRGRRERGVMSGDLSCGASGGVRGKLRDRRRAHVRRERDMVGARHRKGARLGQGAEPRGTTDRTSTHTHATPELEKYDINFS